ncbi:uncharacterized protein LOC143001493 [Genypterus blacodes]|uniref:uncharacterized protein LOC143001493 n=1 Tax=Genypterus blacodes TaxID=154954 RepID=UPI003F75D869
MDNKTSTALNKRQEKTKQACPFSKRGLCERPHCFYQHAAKVEDMLGAYDVECAVASETNDGCLQELERLNKEIETVKHEVEKEQRRLSRYRTEQTECKNSSSNPSDSKRDMAGKNADRDSCRPPVSTDLSKTCSNAKKYVIDNSKPRTDLEYDPLSNFSADWRSYSSSRGHKVKNGNGVKRARDAVYNDQKKPLGHPAQFSQSPSLELLDDSREDDVLVIDIPPSPEKKRGRAQKPSDDVDVGTSVDLVEDLMEDKSVPITVDSPQLWLADHEAFKVASPCVAAVEDQNLCGANDKDPSNLSEIKDDENETVDVTVIDLSKCLEELRSRSCNQTNFQTADTVVEKSQEGQSLSVLTDPQDSNHNSLMVEEEVNKFCSEISREMPHRLGNVNPLQPCSVPQTLHGDQHAKQSQKSATSAVCSRQKMSSQTKGQMQDKAAVNQNLAESHLEHTNAVSGSSQYQSDHVPLASNKSHLPAESSSTTPEQLSVQTTHKEVIVIDSSSEEEAELNYSDVDMSDSDPMEECYRIFIEANKEEKANAEPTHTPVSCVTEEKLAVDVKAQTLPGKKRIAHEAEHTEMVRPQPQVLVPLRVAPAVGPAPQPSALLRIQQVQQRALTLKAAVKGGQAFVSSACPRKPETLIPVNNPAPATQNASMSYISLGTGVIKVGHNLHLILPEGTFPLSVASGVSSPGTPVFTSVTPALTTVTSVLTPIAQVLKSPLVPKPKYQAVAHRYCTAPPIIIPPLGRKPCLTSAFASSPVGSSGSQPAAHVPAKLMPAKRKVKQHCETVKVPHDVRQRYVNMFTEEFLKTTANVNDAFEKALSEERTVYNRSVNKLKYLSVAVNALKRLKNQSVPAAKDDDEVTTQKPRGNIPLNKKMLNGNADLPLYECFKDYALTEEMLIESNYPLQHPEKPGSAALFADNKKGKTDSFKRICCRCGATYSVSQTGKHTRKEECNYHYGKGVKRKVPGGVETRYSCCQGVMGSSGCQTFKLHVHDAVGLDGFVSTLTRLPSDSSCPGVYAVDCEMCYTIHGLELSRVTVVNSSLQVIYDVFVSPDDEVIDYNTRFSGISEEDVSGNHTSFKEVQQTLLGFINADTILIGHGLETHLCALKLIHGTVVDISVVFPHRLGPPHKLTLNQLTADHLRRIIQQSVCGQDTAEDAAACMELMLWKAKEDGKLKK